MSDLFDWIPFYKELAHKLLAYEHRQTELVEILNEIRQQGFKAVPVMDKNTEGQTFLLQEIDPFTFFGSFNRGLTVQNRQGILKILKEKFSIQANVPEHFTGIPVMNNQKSWFIAYQYLRHPSDVQKLWSLFKIALADDPLNNPMFNQAFDDALKINGARYNLTMGLFWIRHDQFVGMDGVNRAYLGADSKPPSARSYREFLKKAASTGLPFYELSHQAVLNYNKPAKPKNVDTSVEESPANPSHLSEWLELAGLTGIPEKTLISWHDQLKRKGQIILQGPPGTGKTFVGQHLANFLAGKTGLVEKVQFHPSYSYEDFIQGFRPTSVNGQLVFELKDGIFKQFCQTAQTTDGTCVFLIDEINRANLSKVFGELMYLLEYRDETIQLQSGESFSIPKNVLIIGTMNTADRSIALMDHALRRRFSFLDLLPNYDLLYEHLQDSELNVEALITILQAINETIGDSHYWLGHSYFLSKSHQLAKHLPSIWEGEIYPYLSEYFFDQADQVKPFTWERVQASIYGLPDLTDEIEIQDKALV